MFSHLTTQCGSPSVFQGQTQRVVGSLTLVRWLHAATAWHEGTREGPKDRDWPCADGPSVQKPCLWHGAESSRFKLHKLPWESPLDLDHFLHQWKTKSWAKASPRNQPVQCSQWISSMRLFKADAIALIYCRSQKADIPIRIIKRIGFTLPPVTEQQRLEDAWRKQLYYSRGNRPAEL